MKINRQFSLDQARVSATMLAGQELNVARMYPCTKWPHQNLDLN